MNWINYVKVEGLAEFIDTRFFYQGLFDEASGLEHLNDIYNILLL